jgi:gluconolactonase
MALRRALLVLFVAAGLSACGQTPPSPAPPADAAAKPSIGSITRLDPALDAIVPADAAIDKIAGGFGFTEGPLWRASENRLWFSDVTGNALRAVTPAGQAATLIEQAGGVSTAPAGSFVGPNGMAEDTDGTVLLAQHTDRRIVRVSPDLHLTAVVERYQGKRFNSPNDVVFGPGHALYFTDPPFGLVKQDDDPAKELKFNGVFRFADGRVDAIVKDLGRPNGIAFSPDMHTMYVSNTEANRKVWMAYDVAANGTVSNARVLLDATAETADGLPDGFKVDREGNLFASGPGGIWVISPAGRHLGTVKLPETPANCAWGDDGHSLYVTAQTSIYRIHVSTGR